MVSTLFDQVATASTLRPLQLDEVLDWAGETLNRVNRDVFFERFQTAAAVQYFYEPFLAAFDPTLRRELGVWYTPPEVVEYMVAQVDRVLREDFRLADGLANERVYLLDPCTGTGSFLVEALRTIHATRAAEVGDAFVGEDVKRAALERMIGFEILPAPFVVAHLQLGLLLRQLGAPLTPRSSERVAVYLTNALTGWAEEPHAPLTFPGLERERDAADHVKHEAPILVVLGNPPYNAFAGVSPAEEGGLVDIYKEGLEAWAGGTKQSLDDLYVRFLRIAERRITELGRGVVCLISNFSYLADPSHVIVRKRLLTEFDRVTIDSLNGDSRETGKKTPDGLPDPSIFAAPGHSGITVGTAIGTLVRRETRSDAPAVRFRNFWGASKRADLVASLTTGEPAYREVLPVEDNAYAFRPQVVHGDYYRWPRVAELAEQAPLLGLLENRRGALLAFDRDGLTARLAAYFDATIGLDDLPDEFRGIGEPAARFDPDRTRRRLLGQGGFRQEALRRFVFKPLDRRWAYVETTRPLWNDPRPELVRHAAQDTRFLLVRRRVPRALDGAAFYLADCLGDQHALHKDAYFIPMRLLPAAASDGTQGTLELGDDKSARANLSPRARTWLAELGLVDPDTDTADSDLAWLHALAIGYSPRYLDENRDGGRFTYQRIPLPSNLDQLRASAQLGARVAALLDVDRDVPGVTRIPATAPDAARWRSLAATEATHGGRLEPADLVLNGWAIVDANGTIIPGAGVVQQRPFTDEERAGLLAVNAEDGDVDQALALLGGQTCDVRLGPRAQWRNVPAQVWEYKIGGYQVLRKWLSYRDERVAGRPLTVEEARTFSSLVRRIAALLLLGPALDTSYLACRDAAWPWTAYPSSQR